MPQKIETAGVYIGTIIESGLSLTKKGYPQAILRLASAKKYVESEEEIEHFQKQGLLQDGQPAYVDWSAFGEEGVYYGTMFNSATEFSDSTKLLNYEQLQLATGWDGTEFDSFTNGSFVGKQILFRVQEKKAYINDQGKQIGGDGTLEIGWIDNKDAPPQRQLKSVEADQVKSLNAMLKGMGKPAAKPAASAVTKPAPAAPVASPSVATVTASTPPAASAPAPAAVVTPKPPTKRKAKESTPAPAESAAAPSVPAEATQGDAWAYVCAHKGEQDDQAVEEAWIDACATIGSDKEESQFTGADWAQVRDLVLKKIAA